MILHDLVLDILSSAPGTGQVLKLRKPSLVGELAIKIDTAVKEGWSEEQFFMMITSTESLSEEIAICDQFSSWWRHNRDILCKAAKRRHPLVSEKFAEVLWNVEDSFDGKSVSRLALIQLQVETCCNGRRIVRFSANRAQLVVLYSELEKIQRLLQTR